MGIKINIEAKLANMPSINFTLTLYCILIAYCSFGSFLDGPRADEILIVKPFGVEQGLSQNTIYDIFQDSYGFIWLATEHGINRFDGKQLLNFNSDPAAPFDITSSKIHAINQDQHQHIWLATPMGIALYDPINHEFSYINLPVENSCQEINPVAQHIIKDKDNRIWVASRHCLYQYEKNSNQFIDYTIPSTSIDNPLEITDIITLTNGSILISTKHDGIIHFEFQSHQFTQWLTAKQLPDGDHIQRLAIDKQQRLWLGGINSLSIYSQDFNQQQAILNPLLIFKNTNKNQGVKDILVDKYGDIWVAVYGDNIYKFSAKQLKITQFKHTPNRRYGLHSNLINKLFEDSRGMIWLGTQDYGSYIWDHTSSAFSDFNHFADEENSISHEPIWSITADEQANLWISTDHGLHHYHALTKKVKRFIPRSWLELEKKPIIHKILKQPNDEYLWLASDHGLFRYASNLNDVEAYEYHRQNLTALTSSVYLAEQNAQLKIHDMVIDDSQQLWIATQSGLSKINLITNQISHYTLQTTDSLIVNPHDAINKLYLDSQDTLWVGTNSGLNRYDPNQDNFQRFLEHPVTPNANNNRKISSIYEVDSGIIWVSYKNQGISMLDFNHSNSTQQQNPLINHLTTKEGLPSNQVFGIISDIQGRVWISTISGLALYDPTQHNIRVFTAKDGLLSTEFTDKAELLSNKGIIYFGTHRGLISIQPENVLPPAQQPKLIFTHAIQHQPKENRLYPIITKDNLKLNISNYPISLYFTDFNFISGETTQYAYRLNQQNYWKLIGNSHSITLDNLKIGNHQLSIKAVNQQDDKIPATHLKITVVRQWWNKQDTYVICLFLMVMSLLLWFRQRKTVQKKVKHINTKQHLFAEAFKNTNQGVMIFNNESNLIAINQAFSQILGFSQPEALAHTNIFESQKHDPDFYARIWNNLHEQHHWQGQIWLKNKQSIHVPLEMFISTIDNKLDKQKHYVAIFSEISERLTHEQQLRKLAKFDALTGLPNRTLFQDRLEHAILHSHREQQKLALMFLDLDKFKQVNDSLGHDIGDLLLVAVAKRISKLLLEDDTIARFGGDEFVVILEDIAEINKIAHIANMIIKELTRPFQLQTHQVLTSTSIGIAIYPVDGYNSQQLIKCADTAMYHAKAEGRNNLQFYAQSMNVQTYKRLTIEAELRQALAEEQFILHYQPRVDSLDGSVHSLEALIRWDHPVRGILAPKEFLDIAESSGLIIPISEWVINKACHQISTWTNAGFSQVALSVNISPRLFKHYHLCDFIEYTLQNYQISPSRLELEISESILTQKMHNAIETLHQLSDLGCRVSIDDFGLNHSSLTDLPSLPIHILKIDHQFIASRCEEDKYHSLVDIFINLALKLDLEVVSKGVETSNQFELLQGKTRQQIQGFYFSKAVESSAVIPLLTQGFQFSKPKLTPEAIET